MATDVFTEQQKKPTVTNIFLLEITAGLWCRSWVLHSGNTYKISTSLRVTALKFNTSTTLTQRTTIADVDANAGSWYWDPSANVLYVRAPSGQTVFSGTYLATVQFYFANKPKTFNNNYYDPRLKSIPRLSIRIEAAFSGSSQMGSGSCDILNNDGYFDALDSLHWDAGSAVFKMGIDDLNNEMDYSAYTAIGNWIVEDWELSTGIFRLKLIEKKTGLEKNIPLTFYDRDTYPNLKNNSVGKPIQIAYGRIYGASPVLIDSTLKKFKLAGHAIKSIEEVRMRVNVGDASVWQVVNPASKDLANGEFTMGTEFDDKSELSVDFIGKKNGDGTPMYNPSDIVKDICNTVGIDTTNSTSSTAFTAAYNYFDVGLDANTNERRTVFKPGIYIERPTQAFRIIQEINAMAGSYLYFDFSGNVIFEAWQPARVSTLATFTEKDFIDGLNIKVGTRHLFSKMICRFAERMQDKWEDSETVERVSTQHAHAMTAAEIKEVSVKLWDRNDVRHYAQRLLSTEGIPETTINVRVPWQAFLLLPGDKIRVTDNRGSRDMVLEVLEVAHDLTGGKVQLVLGNQRGFGDSFGFWMADTQAAWSASDTASKKTENKQESGYWTDDNGLAISTDADSFNVSRWN